MSDRPEETKTAAWLSDYGKIAVSVLTLGIFGAALFLSWRVSDQPAFHDLFITLATLAGSMAVTAVQFWLGSSFGSQRKTNMLAERRGGGST